MRSGIAGRAIMDWPRCRAALVSEPGRSGFPERPYRDVWPAQTIEIELHQLCVLELKLLRLAWSSSNGLDPEDGGHFDGLRVATGRIRGCLEKGGVRCASAGDGFVRGGDDEHRGLRDVLPGDGREEHAVRVLDHGLSHRS